MITTYINEYFTTLMTNLPENAINNAVGLVSALLVYIPIHYLLKWLIGEKNARYGFVAYLLTLVVTLTTAFVGA